MSPIIISLIPAYNEAARISGVVTKTRVRVDEVIVVDDGSDDDTAAVAEGAGAKVLRHKQNRGKGSAIVTAGRAGHKIVSVPVRTIYETGRASHIHPLRDTVRFFKLVARLWRH